MLTRYTLVSLGCGLRMQVVKVRPCNARGQDVTVCKAVCSGLLSVSPQLDMSASSTEDFCVSLRLNGLERSLYGVVLIPSLFELFLLYNWRNVVGLQSSVLASVSYVHWRADRDSSCDALTEVGTRESSPDTNVCLGWSVSYRDTVLLYPVSVPGFSLTRFMK